jgi:hypothetical protein
VQLQVLARDECTNRAVSSRRRVMCGVRESEREHRLLQASQFCFGALWNPPLQRSRKIYLENGHTLEMQATLATMELLLENL